MRRSFLPLFTKLAAFSLLVVSTHAAEPWSDARLPVKDGLKFWYDCAVQAAGRRALLLPPPPQGSGLDHLLDASGSGRHLSQGWSSARPRLVKEPDPTFLVFDGKDDALASGLVWSETTELSVFLVAAPQGNPGGFSAFFSVARAGVNDYMSGVNLDFGPRSTPRLSYVNAEGDGAMGSAQLLKSAPLPFGGWHIFGLESEPGREGVRLFVDGKAEGSRSREQSNVALQQLMLGARNYSHSDEPPYAQGFFQGGIAEFLLFSRVLKPAERSAIEEYLKKKHAKLLERGPDSLAQALEPAVLEIPGEPRPRNRSEIEEILKAAGGPDAGTAGGGDPFEIVLCAGPKDHGEGEHDYPLWQTRWRALLAGSRNVKLSTAWEWPTAEQWEKAQVVVFYSNNPGWSAARAKVLDGFLVRGGGLVYIHYAVDGHGEVEALANCIGYAWRGGVSKFRHGPLDLQFANSPITAGFKSAHFVDESYWNLIGKGEGVQVIATGVEDGKPQPLIWTRSQGKGRVYVNILGHYTWTFDDPLFRILLLRGICWAGGQPVDRLSQLAIQGARLLE